jgi:hypothetical protein
VNTALGVAAIVVAVGGFEFVWWACGRDAPGLLQHYREIGGDELQEAPRD